MTAKVPNQSSPGMQRGEPGLARRPGGVIVLSDIGGTNARFALLDNGRVGPVERFAVADYQSVTDALEAFLDRQPCRPELTGALVAAAGPVEGNRCEMTNSHWVIDAASLKGRFALRDAIVVNDFHALAWSLLKLESKSLHAVGRGNAARGAPAAVIGPGTGLGVSCLVPAPHGPVVLATEGGHVTLAGADMREDAVIAEMRARFGHVSAERALSGMGLQNLYRAIAGVDGIRVDDLEPEQITAGATDGSCPVCAEALDMFFALLGGFAGNAALIFGARGGLFIGGGIVPHAIDYFEKSAFRERFEAKGRHRDYLAHIPTQVIMHRDPAILGLNAMAEQLLAA
jgi:glucokinase